MADTSPRSNFNRRPHASIVAFAGCRVDGSRGSDYSPDRPSAAITDHLNVAYVIFFLLGAGTVLPPAPVGIRALCNADMPRPDHANPPCPHRPFFPSAPSDDSIARVRAYSVPPLPKRPSSACPEVHARRHMTRPSVSAVQVFPWNACAPQTPDCARLPPPCAYSYAPSSEKGRAKVADANARLPAGFHTARYFAWLTRVTAVFRWAEAGLLCGRQNHRSRRLLEQTLRRGGVRESLHARARTHTHTHIQTRTRTRAHARTHATCPSYRHAVCRSASCCNAVHPVAS